MPRYPETRALMEQAVRHVLTEQEKLLKRADSADLVTISLLLSRLAMNTSNQLVEGFNRVKSTAQLTKEARQVEKAADELSKELWTPILVSVSAIYERIEQSFKKKPGKKGLVADTRAHYHNMRIRLLEQHLGARMLVMNSDLGDENERIWQQFLERQLGPTFRVLRGGQICDHQGNLSCQMDLIVVPAGAQVFVPGDSDDGKAQVFVDQVISAIMVTSNLTAAKFKGDWESFQSVPVFEDFEKDHPGLKGHPWPLCYMLAAQSDSVEDLEKAWEAVCKEGHLKVVPQLVVTLDAGYLYCGLRRWPCPRYPGNYKEADHVHSETGIYAGLGLAWLLAQHQGRLAAIQRQNFGPTVRFAGLLDEAMLREGTPPTWSPRFDSMFRIRPLGGIVRWGGVSTHAHNELALNSIAVDREGASKVWEVELMLPETDLSMMDGMNYTKHLRWFRYSPGFQAVGRFLALEEWLEPRSKTEHRSKIVVFEVNTGRELTGPLVESLKGVLDIEGREAEFEAAFPAIEDRPH